MHDLDRVQFEMNPEYGEMGYEQELPGGTFEGPFGETELNELAMELLSVQSEQELDMFLGKLFKKAAGAVGKFVKSPVGKALGGVLRTAAKTALPAVGSALGSFIPIPGVGTAVGGMVGKAISDRLELEGLSGEDEVEAAKKFVQIAGTAAQTAASAPPNVPPPQAAMQAVKAAVQGGPSGAAQAGAQQGAGANAGSRSGRWFRRGRRIVLVGV